MPLDACKKGRGAPCHPVIVSTILTKWDEQEIVNRFDSMRFAATIRLPDGTYPFTYNPHGLAIPLGKLV